MIYLYKILLSLILSIINKYTFFSVYICYLILHAEMAIFTTYTTKVFTCVDDDELCPLTADCVLVRSNIAVHI